MDNPNPHARLGTPIPLGIFLLHPLLIKAISLQLGLGLGPAAACSGVHSGAGGLLLLVGLGLMFLPVLSVLGSVENAGGDGIGRHFGGVFGVGEYGEQCEGFLVFGLIV